MVFGILVNLDNLMFWLILAFTALCLLYVFWDKFKSQLKFHRKDRSTNHKSRNNHRRKR